MSVVSLKQLLEAGVHFGHQTRRWNPQMKPYIYTERGGVHIINLDLTCKMIDEAYAKIKTIAAEGGKVLFVGTKKQAQESVAEEATRCGMYYVNNRWLGGMLTNFKTMRSRVARMKELEKMEADGMFEVLPKKEVMKLKGELEKLQKNLNGIRDMDKLPDLLFVVDAVKEHLAIQEAHILGIPVAGIVDTNCNPDDFDIIIPGNDDAIRAVKLLASVAADAIIEANQGEEYTVNKEEDEEVSEEE